MIHLVTGANGFIGGRLLLALRDSGDAALGMVRSGDLSAGAVRGDLTDIDSLRVACTDVHTVFHCAGYAHVLNAADRFHAELNWRINFQGTRNLVEAAGRSGVKRIVFLSSVKAMADGNRACIDESFPGEPLSEYGKAKLAAERVLLQLGEDYGVNVINLRLSMVYGRGCRGNLDRLIRMIRLAAFPPLPETGNHRSLVHVNDVVSALLTVAAADLPNGATYVVTGPEAPSGRELYDAIRRVLGYPARDWAVPESLLYLAARCFDGIRRIGGGSPMGTEVLERLLNSAWYSGEKIERELGWRGKIGLEQGLREMIGK